jgi:hypothetical protein
MTRKDVIFAILTTFCLCALMFTVIPIRSGQPYDPWADINDDGKINMYDIGNVASRFSTAGDSTKNVNVTNWPSQQPTFPRNLVLKGTFNLAYKPDLGLIGFELIDEDTPYPPDNSRRDNFSIVYQNTTINTTKSQLFDRTFIYDKMPTKSYQILGSPRICLAFNISLYTTGGMSVECELDLGVTATDGSWSNLTSMSSGLTSYNSHPTPITVAIEAAGSVMSPIIVDPLERLSLRLKIDAYSFTGTSTISGLSLLVQKETDEFLAIIPIVEGS